MTALVDDELVTMLELSQSTQLTHVLRAWIAAGLCYQSSSSERDDRRGNMAWAGEVWGYRITFQTGNWDILPGTFTYRTLTPSSTSV